MKHPIIASALLLFSVPALADSDGYYCLGPSYLAYELKFDKPDAKHTLYEVRSGGKKLWETRTYALEDFQVHGLKCGEESIEVVSWDSIFSIGRKGKSLELLKKTPLAAAGKVPQGYDASWFWRMEPDWHGQKAVPFPSAKKAGFFDSLEYVLVADPKRCRSKLTARLRRYSSPKAATKQELIGQQPKLEGELELFSYEQGSECAGT